MKLTVTIYQDFNHDTRKELSIEATPALLNQILTGIVLSDIVGHLSDPKEDDEE